MSAVPQRILAADVGGTNCRFGLFLPDAVGWQLVAVGSHASSTLYQEQDFLAALAVGLDVHPQNGDALAVALAGPVANGTACLTNGRLRISAQKLGRIWGTSSCLLLNDFAAQAHACHSPVGERASHVAGPQSPGDKEGGRAVLGAGTGLGAAQLVRVSGCWQALASEFGHTAFAFVGQEEQSFADFLCARSGLPFASVEAVLGGQGLAHLHEFLSGERLSPPEVGANALSHDSPTLRLYTRFYGRTCRHWILSSLCQGGLWITGGIAQANQLCLYSSSFHDALLTPGPMQSLVATVPVRLLQDPHSGLWGAAWAFLNRA